MKILALIGEAGSGKDTFFSILKNSHITFAVRVALADKVKEIARDSFDWDGVKDDKGRKLLQDLGTTVGRAYNPNIWINNMNSRIQELMSFNCPSVIVVTDVRFLNELKFLQQNYHTTTIRIKREHMESALTNEQQHHVSETELADYSCDYTVENNGSLEDFKKNIMEVMKKIESKA